MSNFDSKYWNLSQAAAWVVYRKRNLVEQFSTETAYGWGALLMYPKMHGYERVGDLDDLVNKLTLGKLTAWGRRNDIRDELEAIPSREWNDLWISPPSVKRSHPVAGEIEPWTGLRFESSELKKRWRDQTEVQSRTKYHWDVFDAIWKDLKRLHPLLSENRLIIEAQLEYKARYKRSPGRTTIQNRIKR